MPLPIAPNYVLSTGTSGVSAKSVTLPYPVLAGDMIVVAGAVWRASDPSPIVVTDGIGTSYTVLETGTIAWVSGFSRGFIAYGRAKMAGTVQVTVTPSGSSSFITFTIIEGALGALDAIGTENSGTGTAASGVITTLNPNAVIVGLLISSSPASPTTYTPAAGVFQIAEDEQNANSPFNFVWRQADTAVEYTLSWTLGTSRDWRVISMSFQFPRRIRLETPQMLGGLAI